MTQIELFKKLRNQYANQLPFVVFKQPNTWVLKAFFQEDDQLHTVSGFDENGFVFAPFDTDKHPVVLIPSQCAKIVEVVLEEDPEIRFNNSSFFSDKQKEKHINLVETGIEAISSEQLKKVVLSRCETVLVEHKIGIDLYAQLIQHSNNYVYYFYHPKVGEWLGATPEILLQIHNNQLTTMSLAGTKTENDVWTAKEFEEQQLVTNFIVDSLNGVATKIQLSEVETVVSGNIQHLRTLVTASLTSNSTILKTLLKNLHPTPAVCGVPKNASKNFILNNENYDRAYYTGFLGELNSLNTTNLFVNLRCMQLKKGCAFIYAGGGITKNSIPLKEWEETVKKMKAMASVL